MRLKRALNRYDGSQSFLQERSIEELLDRLSLVERRFETGIALAGRLPLLAQGMRASGKVDHVLRLEEAWSVAPQSVDRVIGFDDLALAPHSVDLVICPLSLHFADDLPGVLIQIRRALRPDGLLLASLPGPETLRELRQAMITAESAATGSAAMRVDAFTDIRDAGMLLQRAGFALPVVDQESVTVRYGSARALVDDLRGFGVSGLREPSRIPPLSRASFSALVEVYARDHGDADGRVRATFQTIHLSGWAPHDSQQKPLRPGSAKARLADALRTDEIKFKE